MKNLMTIVLALYASSLLGQQKNIYHNGWIDFNKNGKKDLFEDSKQPINKRVENLLSQMTLEEKSCQMATLYGYGRVLKDELPTENWKNEIWKDGIANIDEDLNSLPYNPKAQSQYSYPFSRHAEAINTIQKWFVEETRMGIPVDFTNEGIHGLCHDRATPLPAPISIGSTWDKALVRHAGQIVGREAKALGYTNIYAPILDPARDQRWGRVVECYGEDPFLIAEMGKQMCLGIQEQGVASTLKHYAVYSIPKGGRDGNARTAEAYFLNTLLSHMKKISILLIAILCVAQFIFSQTSSLSHPDTSRDNRMKWWRDARFGMFIHWGVYSVPAGTYKGQRINRIGEWIMNRGKIPVAEYQQFAKEFNPVNYDADAWVKMAKDAGMKYIVITAKHHDGFAMFKSNASKWNIADATPYGKDVLKQLAAACKKYGIKLGFYYSQAQDWNNPGGAASRRPASEGWANPDSAKIDAYTEAHNGHWDPAQETKTMSQYIDDVAVPQVKELLTNYGDVAVLWWDTPTNMTDEYAAKLNALLSLQPMIITNDRLKRPNYPGDYKTPEQRIPDLKELDGKDWETCMTMNETWGYKSYAHNWKSVETLVRNLIDIASKGGNYLLNVGPKSDGTFPQESIDILKGMGSWMQINSEAIYGTKANPLAPMTWGRITAKDSKNGTTLYLSVFDWPKDGKLIVPGLKNEVASAKLLANGQTLKSKSGNDGLEITLPEKPLDMIATVIKVEVKGAVGDQKTTSKDKMKTGELD